jgi:hypothetical protein
MKQETSRRMGSAGYVAYIGEMTNVYKILVRKSQGKRPGFKWEDNIKINRIEIACECVDFIQLFQDTLQL